MSTGISWTHWPGTKGETWNPLRARTPEGREGWACERISPGCENCYAETLNVQARYQRGTGLPYRVGAKVEHYLDAKTLAVPLGWRSPRTVFVCSMTDLFGSWVTDEQIAAIFGVMASSRQHTFLILTKRARRMREWGNVVAEWPTVRQDKDPASVCRIFAENRVGFGQLGVPFGGDRWPLPNVMLGVSVEDQQRADERIPELLAAPAAGRFVSYEPALGPVDFNCINWERADPASDFFSALESPRPSPDDVGLSGARLDWIIGGAESGAGRRTCETKWLKDAADQCAAAGVPWFTKQGSHQLPGQQGALPDALWATKQFPKVLQ